MGHQGGGHARTGDHLGRRARHERGEGHDPRACPTGPASPAARSGRSPTPGSTSARSSRTPPSTGLADISFTLPENELERAEPILEQLADEIGAEGFTCERDIAKVSVVGAGMKSNPGVAAAIFEALADAGINIEIISTSSIRVSCVVPAADCERAVNVIHERLKLARRLLRGRRSTPTAGSRRGSAPVRRR